jgi:hypothetical protein
VRELFFTMWGDGGAYCEFDSALAGLTWAADLAYGGDGADQPVAALFAAVCGGDYRRQLLPAGLHVRLDGLQPEVSAPTMMWDDPLLGIGWAEYQALIPDCWRQVLAKLRALRKRLAAIKNDPGPADLAHALNICDLFIKKLEFRAALVKAYDHKNRAALRRLKKEGIPSIIAVLDRVQDSFRRQWLRRNKPFGLEVIQIRLAGQRKRYEETALRLQEWLDGKIPAIAELDARIVNAGHPVSSFDWLATGSLRV